MDFVNSSVFVLIVISSPVWLSLLAYATRKDRLVTSILWSFASLASILDVILMMSGPAKQVAIWAELFSGIGLLWIPVSIASIIIAKKLVPEKLPLPVFVMTFLSSFLGLFFGLRWVYLYLGKSLAWIPELWDKVVALFRNLSR